jgi:hypothetical protein
MRSFARQNLLRGLAVAVTVGLATGCYHATIETGRPQSGQRVERKWAHGFLFGLVPPSTVEAAQGCPNGIARVETQLTFLNQIANIITFGIYTPMTIQVWCASGGTGDSQGLVLTVPTRDREAVRSTIAEAAARSARSGEAVYVRLAD